MKISGNQTAISEVMMLLDQKFVPPFACKCNNNGDNGTHLLSCNYQNKDHENKYGCNFFEYEIEYDGINILSIKLLSKNYSNGNILNGCIH